MLFHSTFLRGKDWTNFKEGLQEHLTATYNTFNYK